MLVIFRNIIIHKKQSLFIIKCILDPVDVYVCVCSEGIIFFFSYPNPFSLSSVLKNCGQLLMWKCLFHL